LKSGSFVAPGEPAAADDRRFSGEGVFLHDASDDMHAPSCAPASMAKNFSAGCNVAPGDRLLLRPRSRMKLPLLGMLSASLACAASAPPLRWADATFTTHEKPAVQVRGQRATLVVPEDATRPDGARVELALLRLPATTRSPGPPIVYLHGGPGGSGAEHLEQPEFRVLFAALQATADVIIFDQRGCGRSQPSLTPGPVAARFTIDTLATRESFLAFLEHSSAATRDRLIRTGHDPHCFTIRNSMDDLEAIRLALGAEKIDLLAHSYGTQLAQAFVRAHPAAVRRSVLVGSRGMDTARKLPAEADAHLALLADLARNDPTVAAKFPDLLATLRGVLAKLDAAPIEVELEDAQKQKLTLRVGGFALRFIVAKFYLNDPDNAKYLPKLLDEIETGRRPWCLVFNLMQMLRSPVSYAWFTTDAASGVSAGRAEVIRAQATRALLGDAMNFPFPDINDVWQMPDLGDEFRAPVQADVPTLFVAGTLDGITPVAQSEEIMRGFSNARRLVVENAGHNSQLRPPEVVAAISGFFAGREPPARAQLAPMTFMPLIAQQR
jgi:pimeloyl-ACP methyl ester carboxylesterase